MKITITTLILCAFLFSATSVESDRFSLLYQLEGTWTMKTKRGLLYERWKKISGHELQAKSFKLNGKDTVFFERVQLVEKEADIFYIPIIENQNDNKPVSFKLITSDDNKFTFENKLHDFPQRIIYHFITNDSIVARIEGQKSGVSNGSDYYFKRLK